MDPIEHAVTLAATANRDVAELLSAIGVLLRFCERRMRDVAADPTTASADGLEGFVAEMLQVHSTALTLGTVMMEVIDDARSVVVPALGLARGPSVGEPQTRDRIAACIRSLQAFDEAASSYAAFAKLATHNVQRLQNVASPDPAKGQHPELARLLERLGVAHR